MIIAFAGKGGVGKSTISSQIIKRLSKKDLVLAVDADPNSNLGDKLGIETYGTIGTMRNELVEDPDKVPASVTKQEYIASRMMQTLGEGDNIDLLAMGMPEGKGCYCFVNDVLRHCFAELIPRYNYTVVDNEAGMEHLSRGVLPKADVLVFVSDPTITGVKTAGRLSDLADSMELPIERKVLVVNNVPASMGSDVPEVLRNEAAKHGLDEVFAVPHDEELVMSALNGEEIKIPADCPFSKAVDRLSQLITE